MISALQFFQQLLVTVWQSGTCRRIGVQKTTTDHSSCMVCQSYWNLYHWQSEHKFVSGVMLLRQFSAFLCDTFTVTPIMTDE
jgi:hypothetical protein